MILSTHILIGGAAAKTFVNSGNIPMAVVVAVISHYVSDIIPHTEYKPQIIRKDDANPDKMTTNFRPQIIAKDLLKFSLDGFGGAAMYLYFSGAVADTQKLPAAIAVIIASVLPDFLQFIYAIMPNKITETLQKWHNIWHTENKLKPTLGPIVFQLFIAAIALLFLRSHP